jgi:hypothetical protein
MKKYILAVLMIVILAISCAGCGITYQKATEQVETGSDDFGNGYFTTIISWNNWSDSYDNYKIVFAKDTKVKYFVITGNNKIAITPLYNSDGTLQVYESE